MGTTFQARTKAGVFMLKIDDVVLYTLPGMERVQAQPLPCRRCSKCDTTKPVGGGVWITPRPFVETWVCSDCRGEK